METLFFLVRAQDNQPDYAPDGEDGTDNEEKNIDAVIGGHGCGRVDVVVQSLGFDVVRIVG